MVCESCGEKPKNTAKDFTKAVIEINNPETLVLLRKVVIPASMGTEENVPVAIGKYRNVVLQYEANGHLYLYSSDGIPTEIAGNVPQEVLDRITNLEAADVVLQREIDEIRDLPAFRPFPSGVVTNGTTQEFMDSILALHPEVGTAYLGTVSLSDMPAGLTQEEVEVYVYSDYVVYCVMRSTDVAPYEWWCASYNYQGWRASGGGTPGEVKVLTESDYNYRVGSTGDNNCINLSLLNPGFYRTRDFRVAVYIGDHKTGYASSYLFYVSGENYNGYKYVTIFNPEANSASGNYGVTMERYVAATGEHSGVYDIGLLSNDYIVDNINSNSSNKVLSASQGRILRDMINSLAIKGSGAPTTATMGTVGKLYEDTTNGKLYICTAIIPGTDPDPDTYTWEEVGAGGGGGLITLSYGNSTWQDFINAYNAGKIVYCRASSNSNPATGSQTRMAFMAYIDNPDSPTEVEFQYVRSVSTKSASNQSDQVFVYTLTNTNGGTWAVETRPVMVKVSAGTNMTSSYSNNTLTLDCTVQNPSYSTSEVDTGATWIDGKTIYKKTYNFGALPDNTTKGISAGITGLYRVIKMEGYAHGVYNGMIVSTFALPNEGIRLQFVDGQIEVRTFTNDWSFLTECYITLYYTKSS